MNSLKKKSLQTPLFLACVALFIALLTGCSLRPVKITAGSNHADEISAQNVLLDQARLAQVDVLASENFEVASNYLTQAKKQYKNDEASDEILETIGYSRAYLQLATLEATSTNSRLKKITKARGEAIKAGARNLPDQLNELDEDLKDLLVRNFKLSAVQIASLQSNYLALEREAVTYTKLKRFKKL